MKRTLSCLLLSVLCACQGPPGDKGEAGMMGDKGDKGDKGDIGDKGTTPPVLTSLTPAVAFPGRTLLVQLSGAATHFSSSSTLSFDDPAIKVVKVDTGSNANLRATIEIGIDAKLGPHDVQISSPSPAGGDGPNEDLTLKGAFTLQPSLGVDLPTGGTAGPTVVQGGLVDLAVRNLDYRDNPFYSQTRFYGPVSSIGQVTASTVRLAGTAIVDALAPAGAIAVGASTVDPFGKTLAYVGDPKDTANPQAKARAATVLTLGTPKIGETISERRATNLYKFTTAADSQVVHMQFSNLGAGFGYSRPVGYTAPASGRFSEGQAFDSWGVGYSPSARNVLQIVQKKGDAYAVVLASDQNGSATHTYSISAKAGAAAQMSSLKEPAGGDSPASPLATIASLDKAYFGMDGTVDAAWEDDYIKFVAKSTGKVYVQVSASPGPRIGIGLRDAACTAVIQSTQYSQGGTMGLEVDVKAGDSFCLRLSGDIVGTTYGVILSPAL